jgi:hypothetical protein
MDRHDESRDIDSMREDVEVGSMDRDIDVTRREPVERGAASEREADVPSDSVAPKRQGDILGLGGSVVPKSPDDPSTEYDEASMAHRRTRSLDMDEPAVRTEMPREKGATGIDMGSGGSGTDLE